MVSSSLRSFWNSRRDLSSELRDRNFKLEAATLVTTQFFPTGNPFTNKKVHVYGSLQRTRTVF